MKKIFLLLMFVSLPAFAAKEFEIFDGRYYNQLFYPMVDAIEWGEQSNGRSPAGENVGIPHMEFHIHMKDKQIELAAVPGEKNGKPVLWLMYDLRFRGEKVCRHIVAPAHFREGMKTYMYRDNSDPDYDNFYVSSFPMKAKNLVEYTPPKYEPCLDENASNKPEARSPASAAPALPTAPGAKAAPVAAPAKDPKNIGVDYDNSAVPFSF